MGAADTATGVATATGGMDIEAAGAVMAAGVAKDTQGTAWVAATTGAAAEATGVRIERRGRCTAVIYFDARVSQQPDSSLRRPNRGQSRAGERVPTPVNRGTLTASRLRRFVDGEVRE